MDELCPKDSHGIFFRSVMADIKNIKDFIEGFLPQEISREVDLTHMRYLPTDKIDIGTKYCMDLAVECSVGGEKTQIYFVLDHKSYSDERILLQILGYMYAIWDEEKRKALPLTPIIPVIVYHGVQEWTMPTDFQERFEGLKEAAKAYMPQFKYVLVDLNALQYEEIGQKAKDNPYLSVSLWLMKYLPRVMLLPKEGKAAFFLYMCYLLDAKRETIEYIIRKKSRGEEMMSWSTRETEAESELEE